MACLALFIRRVYVLNYATQTDLLLLSPASQFRNSLERPPQVILEILYTDQHLGESTIYSRLSSTSSTPILKRTRRGGLFGSALTRCSTNDSTPPRLVAGFETDHLMKQ